MSSEVWRRCCCWLRVKAVRRGVGARSHDTRGEAAIRRRECAMQMGGRRQADEDVGRRRDAVDDKGAVVSGKLTLCSAQRG